MRLLASVFVLLALLAPALAAGKPEDVLLKADRDFNRATQEQRAQGWAAFMADRAVLSHGDPVVGKEAILRSMQEFFSDTNHTLTWDPVRAEMFKSGKMGYTTGRYKMTALGANKTKLTRQGSYITVWQLQSDGSWKVILDTGSPDQPPPATKK